MALSNIEGFDLYNGTGLNTGFQTNYATNVVSVTSFPAGRFGGQCFRGGSTTGWWRRALSSTRGAGAFGFAVRIGSATVNNSNDAILHVGLGLIPQCGISIGLGGTIRAYRLAGGTPFINGAHTLLGESVAGVIQTNVWHYIEWEWVCSATVGRMTVKVDGVTVLNLTNQNTFNSAGGAATATADSWVMGNQINRGWTSLDYDDLYEEDTGASLGQCRVETLRPTADTATKQWTPDTGVVNFSRVNANLAQSATFVQASVVGNLDLYDIADLSATPATVHGVKYNVFAQKTDVATRKIAAVGDIGGTQQISADLNLPGGGVNMLSAVAVTKPGGGAWAFADVNSLRIGPKVTV